MFAIRILVKLQHSALDNAKQLNFCEKKSAWKVKLFSLLAPLITIIAFTNSLLSQDLSPNLSKQFLKKVEHYRYSQVSLFDADPALIKRFQKKETPEPYLDPTIVDDCDAAGFATDIEAWGRKRPLPPLNGQQKTDWLPVNSCESMYRYYQALATQERIDRLYIITEEYKEGSGVDPVILGAVAVALKPTSLTQGKNPKGPLTSTLDNPYRTYSAEDLRQFLTIEVVKGVDGQDSSVNGSMEGTSFSNVLDYAKNYIKQGSWQDIVHKIRSTPSTSEALAPKEIQAKLLPDDEVSQHLMISEGEPHKKDATASDFTDEIVIGVADLVSWRHYDPTSTSVADPGLPLYGIEMRYGNDDIGYPSLWSERVAVNALWDANKLGVILPTSLWAKDALSMLTLPSRFTTLSAGVGLNGSFDFPFKLIDRSGVFTASGSVLFGNNVRYNEQGPLALFQEGIADSLRLRSSFLMRWHGLLNYTFSIGIPNPDQSVAAGYNLRFKIGAAAYQMEEWEPKRTANSKELTPNDRINTTFRPSPFFRVEYMSYGLSVPFGAYVQYFDGSLSSMAWIQVPISETGILTAIRLDGRVFVPVLNRPQRWESSLVAVPSIRFIFRWK